MRFENLCVVVTTGSTRRYLDPTVAAQLVQLLQLAVWCGASCWRRLLTSKSISAMWLISVHVFYMLNKLLIYYYNSIKYHRWPQRHNSSGSDCLICLYRPDVHFFHKCTLLAGSYLLMAAVTVGSACK